MQAKLRPPSQVVTWIVYIYTAALPSQAVSYILYILFIHTVPPPSQAVPYILYIYMAPPPNQTATTKPSCDLHISHLHDIFSKPSCNPQAKLSPTWSTFTPLPLQVKPQPSSQVVNYMVYIYTATPLSQAVPYVLYIYTAFPPQAKLCPKYILYNYIAFHPILKPSSHP